MNDRCVLFFGDSFVNGAGDSAGLGWPGRLGAAAWEAGLALTLYNLGVRGESSLDVAARLRAEATPRLIPEADNRVVLAVGANDVSLDETGAQPITPARSDAALGQMLEACEELGAGALVLGPGPAGVADHDMRSRELEGRWAAICAERGVRFVPILDAMLASEAWRQSAGRNDGIHPGAPGYEALAQLLLERGWLEWLATRS